MVHSLTCIAVTYIAVFVIFIYWYVISNSIVDPLIVLVNNMFRYSTFGSYSLSSTGSFYHLMLAHSRGATGCASY